MKTDCFECSAFEPFETLGELAAIVGGERDNNLVKKLGDWKRNTANPAGS